MKLNTSKKLPKSRNPVAKAMLGERKSPQVVPSKKGKGSYKRTVVSKKKLSDLIDQES